MSENEKPSVIDGDVVFAVRPSPGKTLSILAKAPRTIRLDNGAGKQTVIDFSGDTVTYSGDLPIDESARLFFEAVNPLFNSGRAT